MAEILLSPGVLQRETDTSFIAAQPPALGAAIIGPTVKGPVGIPVTVTSYTDFVNRFGDVLVSGSNTYSYFTSITAYNYFQNGGQALLVTRVATGSYTPANSFVSSSTGVAFTVATISEGIIMNSSSSIDANGSLLSGSINNIRIEVVGTNTGSGTFSLYVRQGNDSTANPIILETWTNLSMDPLDNNYVAKRIGDYQFIQTTIDGTATLQVVGTYPNKSRYIRINEVLKPTPQYLAGGVANSVYTGSIPTPQSQSFNGATGTVKAGANFYDSASGNNTQGLDAGCYTDAIELLASANDYQFNVLVTPGLNYQDHSTTLDTIITNTKERGDNIFVMDLGKYGASPSEVINEASTIDTSYAASYYPWVQTLDPATGKYIWCPPSAMIPGVYAFNDRVAEPWFAPAGINRGGLGNVIRAEVKLAQSTRDNLYQGKVNPLATFPGQGVVVYGQKTLQSAASALDRINVRRLLIALKRQIGQISNALVFQQNTAATRNSFLSQVNPYLESVQQRQGLYAFKVIMDESLNNAAVIDRNELVGQIYLQPTKTAEFIYINFNITPTGATFPG